MTKRDIARKINYKSKVISGDYLVVVQYHAPFAGQSQYYSARVYEIAGHNSEHMGKIFYDGLCWGDIGQNTATKQEKETYRVIDITFPELVDSGFKSDGYIKYSNDEILKSGIVLF